jgi:hypothetical protein
MKGDPQQDVTATNNALVANFSQNLFFDRTFPTSIAKLVAKES